MYNKWLRSGMDFQILRKFTINAYRPLLLFCLIISLWLFTISNSEDLRENSSENDQICRKDYSENREKSFNDDNDYRGFLDDCYHVYLDVGSNVGIQVRKLFQPELYSNASLLPHFHRMFGNMSANPERVCAVGFEANFAHTERLEDLEQSYRKCGFRVHFFTKRAVAHRNHGQLATFYSDGKKHRKEWGATLIRDNLSLKQKWPSKVKLLRLAKFILEAVVNRKLPKIKDKSSWPTVMMKLDIEGAEIEVLTDLLLSGALQHINRTMVEFHDTIASNELRRNVSLDLQKGLEAIVKISQKGLTPINITAIDDESYAFSNLPLPNCP